MVDNILSVLQARLRTRMNEIADHMAGGGCTDYADYKQCAGQIEGLALAERDMLDLVEEEEQAEMDDT